MASAEESEILQLGFATVSEGDDVIEFQVTLGFTVHGFAFSTGSLVEYVFDALRDVARFRLFCSRDR